MNDKMNLTPLQYWLVAIIGVTTGLGLLLYGIIGTIIHNVRLLSE